MKVKKTFTIDSKTWERFEIISNDKALNKSLFIENCIKKLIEKNDNNEGNNNKS